jgi:hypothetical protein
VSAALSPDTRARFREVVRRTVLQVAPDPDPAPESDRARSALARLRRALEARPTTYIEVGNLLALAAWTVGLAHPERTFARWPDAFGQLAAATPEPFLAALAAALFTLEAIAMRLDDQTWRARSSLACAAFLAWTAGGMLSVSFAIPSALFFASWSLLACVPFWRRYLL